MEQTSSGKNFTITSQEEVKGTEPPSFRRWLVLATGFFVMFLATGFAFNLAVLIPELLSSYGKSKAETALVQSITAGMLNIGGTPCGKSVSKYGARVTGIAGSLLVTIGLVCSFFSTRIPHLVVTLGIISGFGFSAVFVSSLTSVGEYFEDKSKLMALAFITFGSGCGGILVPFILDMLINEYGWKGSLLLMGGLMTHMICFFAVCKPIMIGISTTQDSENETSSHRPFVNSLKSLVTNALYIIHVIGVCFTIPAINSSKIFIIDYLNTNGFKSTSVELFLYLQVGTAFGALLPGLLNKCTSHSNVFHIPTFFLIVGTVTFGLFPSAETYSHYVVLMSCLGISLGVSITTISMTTMEVVGMYDYSAGLGVLMTVIGVVNSIAGPLTGMLIDLTGSYWKAFYGLSGSLGFATCLSLFGSLVHWRKQKQSS